MKEATASFQRQQQPREVIALKDNGVVVVDATTTINAVDNLSAKLNQLSLEERNQAIFELHGVAEVEEETKETLETKLLQMNKLMDAYGDTPKTAAYRKALQLNKAYVDQKIKLLCLRADHYNVEKAAARMITFFNFKCSLFGDDKLGKEITLGDLSPDGRHALDSGVFQLLQQRDRSGRGITMLMGAIAPFHEAEAVLEAFYYTHMAALRDEEIQKKGIVHIYYGIGQKRFVSDRPARFAGMWWLLPLRLVAMHLCYEPGLMENAANLVLEAMEAHHLCRLRGHKGSSLECIFRLMTFGIPKEAMPFNTETGDSDLRAHLKWIASRQKTEKAAAAATKPSPDPVKSTTTTTAPDLVVSEVKEIVVPGPMDIIVGLGRQTLSSAGYLRFRDLLQDHRAEYESADRFEKTIISNLLLKKLRDKGCRFVRSTTEGVLSECNEVEAREKISHTFRNMRQQGTRRKGRTTGTTKRSNRSN